MQNNSNNIFLSGGKHIEYLKENFDIKGNEKLVPNVKFELPKDEWNIGIIYGHSGSGKTTLLKQLGYNENSDISFNENSIISNIHDNPKKAVELLSAVGFNTIPVWLNKYENLSNGEKYRAQLAKLLSMEKEIYLVDEYTSVVDRNVAISMSNALSKYVKRKNIKIILSSCHSDIINWVQPNWIFDTNDMKFKKKTKNQIYNLRYLDVEMRLGRISKSIII